MAYKNANRYCKEALRPHRKKSLNDYIRICRDIDGNFIQGQVLATVLRPQGGGDNNSAIKGPRTCFGCGQIGHFCKECPQNLNNTLRRPGLCPRCKRGYHWANDCRSKKDVEGQPLPPPANQGNWKRAQPQGPKANAYGAMTSLPGNGRIRFVPQNNPFTSQTSSGEPQGMQDWTSVPPAKQF